jgi:hypothetical protein
MTFAAEESDPLAPLRGSVALLFAEAAACGRSTAAERLDDALAAIGAPAQVPKLPLTLDDQFPAELFDSAMARLERAAGTRATDRDALIDCWSAVRAARDAWHQPSEEGAAP